MSYFFYIDSDINISVYLYFSVKLDHHPILKLDVGASNPKLRSLYTMLPLHDGSVLVSDYNDPLFLDIKYRVIRLSDTGEILNTVLTTNKDIRGLIMLSNTEVLILYKGSLQRVRIQDWKIQEEYKVPNVKYLNDGIRIDDDQVLLVDRDKGEVITYNMKTRNKHVVIDKLRYPTSVDKAVTDQGVFYIVNEEGAHTVSVYNDRWRLVRSIGGQGDSDGRLYKPDAARVLPDNTIVVTDYWNHRISRFTIQGDFIDHVIKQSDGIRLPDRLAVQYPYVWLAGGDNIQCYQIYR